MIDKIKDTTKDSIITWFINNHGSFGFTSSGLYGNKTPAFQLKVNIEDVDILEEFRVCLGLKNKIYKYHYSGTEKADRKPQAFLKVRDFKQLKNVIIPFFHKNLTGDKKARFVRWIEGIGKDPMVSERFKSLYRLYKSGLYDK